MSQALDKSGEDPKSEQRAAFQQANARQLELIGDGMSLSGRERNCCFLNTGESRFANISSAAGLDHLGDGRAYALVDWDQDGDLDLWATNRTAPRVQFLRNNSAGEYHFVRLQLQGNGTTTNRDAIGARVEVVLKKTDAPKLIRTIHAGEGFLGQSSKWVHFGLGREKQIDYLVVRWPGGNTEKFAGLEVDHNYLVNQGSGNVAIWKKPSRIVTLTAAKVAPPRDSERASILLHTRIPLPPLNYTTFDGSGKLLLPDRSRSGPTLVTLWASWCRPCLLELAELRKHADELRGANLNVVALSVDALAEDEAASIETAEGLLKTLKLPFPVGVATEQMVDQLEIALYSLYDMHIPWQVPASFLFDGEGRLAVVYHGRVEVAALLADVDKLQLEDEAWLTASLPFAGSWVTQPRAPQLGQLAARFFREGYAEAAAAYVSRNEKLLADEPHFPDLLFRTANTLLDRGDLSAAAKRLEQALEINPNYAAAHSLLGNVLKSQDRPEAALAHRRESVRLRPDNAAELTKLGALLQSLGKLDEASERYRRVLELRPGYAKAHNNLGVLLQIQGHIDQAIEHYQQALDSQPEYAAAYNNLGNAYQTKGQLEKAADALAQALRIDPDYAEANFSLAMVLRSRQDWEAAIDHFKRALGAKPDQVATHYQLAQTYVAIARLEAAIGHFRRVVQLQPKAAESHYALGVALSAAGRFDEAGPVLSQALTLRPDSLDICNALAWMLATKPSPTAAEAAEAVSLAKKSAEMTEHRKPEILDTLAAAYAASGDFNEAVSTAERAIALADKGKTRELAEEIRARLKKYRRGEPFRESGAMD